MLFSSQFLAYAGLTLCSAAVLLPSSTQTLLPKPSGTHQVGRSVTELVDNSRIQPFAPEVEPIRLMVSVFYPVTSRYSLAAATYMPPETARIQDEELSSTGLNSPIGTFESVALQLACNRHEHGQQAPDRYPLAIFMPAEGTTRLSYSQIASEIASKGYIVVTIDAPYDVDVVEYPDGSLVGINRTVWDTTNETALAETAYIAIQTRVGDVSFVLDSLSNTTLAHSVIPNLPASGLNTTHTAMFGHSLGGATAFSVLEADERVLGGLNTDGGLFGPGLQNGTDKPFMLMGHANHTRGNQADDPLLTWATVWPMLTGWKRDMIVADTEHYDFSDYPIVFETLGITPGKDLAERLHLGPMEGNRALKIVTSYAGVFLDFVMHGKDSAILDSPVSEFPEVTFEY